MAEKSNTEMSPLCIGILAHVDAGKTTLSEALLYTSGALRRRIIARKAGFSNRFIISQNHLKRFLQKRFPKFSKMTKWVIFANCFSVWIDKAKSDDYNYHHSSGKFKQGCSKE